jgi:hypothetical protein
MTVQQALQHPWITSVCYLLHLCLSPCYSLYHGCVMFKDARCMLFQCDLFQLIYASHFKCRIHFYESKDIDAKLQFLKLPHHTIRLNVEIMLSIQVLAIVSNTAEPTYMHIFMASDCIKCTKSNRYIYGSCCLLTLSIFVSLTYLNSIIY